MDAFDQSISADKDGRRPRVEINCLRHFFPHLGRCTGDQVRVLNPVLFNKRALALDATYAPAWAGIATVATRQVANGHITMAKALVVTREAASKALELDPKNGEANAALVKLLAQEMGVAPRDVALVGGATARIKRLKVTGTATQLIAALEKIAGIR